MPRLTVKKVEAIRPSHGRSRDPGRLRSGALPCCPASHRFEVLGGSISLCWEDAKADSRKYQVFGLKDAETRRLRFCVRYLKATIQNSDAGSVGDV